MIKSSDIFGDFAFDQTGEDPFDGDKVLISPVCKVAF
jgi:hypothetical protein